MGSRGSSSTTGQQPIAEEHFTNLNTLYRSDAITTSNADTKSRRNAEDQRISHLSRSDAQHWNTLSKAEQDAILDYTGAGYKDLNNRLHEGKKLTPKQEETLKHLDAATSRSLPENMILDRGIQFSESELASLKPGSTIAYKGFSSTSAIGNVSGNGMITVRISARKGSKALVVNTHSKHKREGEVLLPRNSKFKVTKVVTQESYTSRPGPAPKFEAIRTPVFYHTIYAELL